MRGIAAISLFPSAGNGKVVRLQTKFSLSLTESVSVEHLFAPVSELALHRAERGGQVVHRVHHDAVEALAGDNGCRWFCGGVGVGWRAARWGWAGAGGNAGLRARNVNRASSANLNPRSCAGAQLGSSIFLGHTSYREVLLLPGRNVQASIPFSFSTTLVSSPTLRRHPRPPPRTRSRPPRTPQARRRPRRPARSRRGRCRN